MKNLSIKMKLIASFSVVLIMIVISTIYSNFGITKIGHGFTDYREMAKNSVLAGRIQANMLMIQLQVTDYINNPHDEAIKEFNEHYEKTEKFIEIAKVDIHNPKRVPMVKVLDEQIVDYKKNFGEVVSYMKQIDDIFEKNLTVNGKKIEELLSSIMLTAEKDGNMRAALDTAHGVRYLLLGRLYTSRFLLTNADADAKKALESFNLLTDELKDIQKLLVNNTRIEQLKLSIELIAKYKKGIDDITKIIIDRNEHIKMLDTIGPKIADVAEELKLSIKADQDQIGPMVAALDHKIFITSMAISAVVLLIVILSAIFIPREISTQLDSFRDGLLDFFKYLNREAEDCKRLDDSSNNEIGTMAKVVNQNIDKAKKGVQEDRDFIDETIHALSEFEQGDLCQRIDINVNNPALGKLRDVINSMGNHMENNINEVLDVLEQYTQYNYLNKVDATNVKHHLLKLSTGVNDLGDSIVQMLSQEKRVGLTLTESSNVLLKNVNILNDVSNEAAASLEETAAALEEITSTIISNTENVVEMATFANKVTISVEEGQVLATQTTSSMDEINEQVTSINEAITVIDQIAFQTNILSLNAAVEAATAGEAGKGFAVVAQEVRNLASRSAEAAKEIKELVENATSKANNGKLIADKMIHGYTDLNENIKKTIELIGHVESASKEQQAGIEQINDAVTQQDQQTQQIASAANQTHEIAVHTSHIADQIVENVESKDFPGKDNIVERRARQYDLEHDEENCRRSSEKKIREHKENRANKSSSSSSKTKEIKSVPKKEENKKVKDVEKNITSKVSDDDEWESF